ncbi:hypothetical protein XENOCAPTIV_029015, partial [Xenoophorus captivus]
GFAHYEIYCIRRLSDPLKSEIRLRKPNVSEPEFSENVCIERRKTTPLKTTESSASVFLMSRKSSTSEVPHITPVKRTVLAEPWSPTTNLKVLISAASPDIRDREMKKVLFRPIENDKVKAAGSEPLVEDAEVEDSAQVCEPCKAWCFVKTL